jgi:hypothetical protein
MEQFEKVLHKYNCPIRNGDFKHLTKQIEDEIGFELPVDYKKYLENYQGIEESIGEEYVLLWGLEKLSETNIDYGINEFLPNTLGIGSNGGGELIALEYKDDSYRIILTPFMDMDEDNHIEIGDSFSDFLIRLDEGREWFN